ncbi:ROK family transcriptional regulator [Streptomyces mexicanus]|uniref:ROK family transcriptional regulator n=1 Tax=Streptomyces mexicanus TaxID=178566 RepID=UPI0036591D44
MPASPSTARAINDRLALRLLQQRGPLTAGQLKQFTGLSRPTVADLVERLTAAGLITVVGESGEQRRGPNARLYGIVADRAHLAALDVRTDSVSVAVADLLGRELARACAPIGTDTGTGPAVEQAVALVEKAVGQAGAERLHTVGVGAPGLIDPGTGELRDSTGLPEWHRRLVTALQERLPGARVIVENETNLAALAEQRDGAARGRDTFVLLWLGRGTGAAESPGADAAEQTAAAGETDGAARAGLFLDALADRIALGVASVAAVLDPGCVVLGGEIGQAGGDVLAARVEQRVARLSPLRTEVRAGALGGTAVLRGALLTARDSAQEDLFTPPGVMLDSPQTRTC